MKQLLIICAAALLVGSCTKDISEDLPGKVRVQVRVQPEGTEAVPVQALSAVNENAIKDVNLYLIDRINTLYVHFYAASAALDFECAPGAYDLYMIVNLHADMGNLTREQVEASTLDAADSYEDLPMTARERIDIPLGVGTLTLPPILVRRRAARIDFRIDVAPDVEDMTVHSVQAMCLPAQAPLFGNAAPTTFRDGPLRKNPQASAHFSGSMYMLPNEQGTVPAIRNQQQKSALYAPAHATWLRIRALRRGTIVDIAVYLGENNTSDFNVRANTAHTLSISIRGDGLADTRIHSYVAGVQAACAVQPQEGFHTRDLEDRVDVRLSGDYASMGASCVLKLEQGQADAFSVNGVISTSATVDLAAGSGTITVRYAPRMYTRDNHLLRYSVTIYDRYGEAARFLVERSFAYVVKVYLVWYDGPSRLMGNVSSPDALHVAEHSSLSSVFSNFYCTAEGCTLVAMPDPGHRFKAWIQWGEAGLLSDKNEYAYYPLEAPDTIYAYFE